ncbi:MAG: DarT ssDNA thymidine ADP-ribosyltransferase family protein [Bacteroidetes bacterium]|nr:DarT ssDNA thymidine ADP-ribosyltransferase family protein [Bacteroidota bacterium]
MVTLSPTKKIKQNKQKYKNQIKQIIGFWGGEAVQKTNGSKAAVFYKWQKRNPEMKIFDWIRGYFDKVRSRFRKKKQEQDVRDRIEKTKGTSQEEVEASIEEKVRQEEPLTTAEILELAETQAAIELQGHITSPKKIRERVFDLVEIEQEVTALNKKLIEVQIKQNQIEPIRFPQNYSTDKDIEELERILQKHNNKQNLTLSTSAIDKLKSRFGQFDKFLQERILVKIYRIREEKRRKEEETKKQQVKELVGRIENLINQGNLQEAQSQLAKVATSISGLRNPEQKKSFREKLEALKAKFRDRQIREEAKRQAEELKKQQEEAERRSLEEEAKREEERLRKEQADLIRKQQEEAQKKKEEEKKQALQRLLAKKSNWQDYAQVLQANEITTLYHFTDRANIDCIKLHGGLFSWQHLRIAGIEVPYEGGGILSKDLDRRYGLEDFVRVCFTENHPMMYVARNEGRIPNPVILKINTEVCEFQNTKFANMNATRNGHNCGNSLADLQRIKFEVVRQRTHFHLSEQDKPYYQAEVLVKTWIPIEYITNINQF